MTNRAAMNAFGTVAPHICWFMNFVIPGRNSSVLKQEAKNKARIMTLVNAATSYVDEKFSTPVEKIVEKCYALGQFPALWALEGTGKDIAEWHMNRNENPTGIMQDIQLDPKWDGAWLMLHAGQGMQFAKYYVDRMKTRSDAEIEHAVKRAVVLCRANSRPGYFGAAMESLGLVSRFMGDKAYCHKVNQVLLSYAPDCRGYFWRGCGRAIYFHPLNFFPRLLAPNGAINMAKREAPDPEALENLMAGIAWAMTVVNMVTPEVMEWALANHDDYFSGSPGYFSGVISSCVMRYDTSPDLEDIQKFRYYKPDQSNPVLAGLWNSKITGSLNTAFDVIYPLLKKHRRLDEVFHYTSLHSLVVELTDLDEPQKSQAV
jgi:hypothetical protein